MEIAPEEYQSYLAKFRPTLSEMARFLSPSIGIHPLWDKMLAAMQKEGLMDPLLNFHSKDGSDHLSTVARKVMEESRSQIQCSRDDVAQHTFVRMGLKIKQRAKYDQRRRLGTATLGSSSPLKISTTPSGGQALVGASNSLDGSPSRKLQRPEPASSITHWPQDLIGVSTPTFAPQQPASFTTPSILLDALPVPSDLDGVQPTTTPQPYNGYIVNQPVPILDAVVIISRANSKITINRMSFVVKDDLVSRSIRRAKDPKISSYDLNYDTWMKNIRENLEYDERMEYIELVAPPAPHPWHGSRDPVYTGRDWQVLVWAGAQQGLNPIRFIILDRWTPVDSASVDWPNPQSFTMNLES